MSGCTLQLTGSSPIRTTLIDEATGHAKYQIDTPGTSTRSATRIRKLDSATQPPPNGDDANLDSDDTTNGREKGKYKSQNDGDGGEEGLGTVPELGETSDEIARVYWKTFSSDRIIFRGKIISKSELLSKCGKMKGYVNRAQVSVGRKAESVSRTRSYLCTGPDGVQYRWAMGATGTNYPKASFFYAPLEFLALNHDVKLVTTDDEKTVIAEFHPAHYFTKRQKARLEVRPAGMRMLDYIVLTFVLVEKERRERERTEEW